MCVHASFGDDTIFTRGTEGKGGGGADHPAPVAWCFVAAQRRRSRLLADRLGRAAGMALGLAQRRARGEAGGKQEGLTPSSATNILLCLAAVTPWKEERQATGRQRGLLLLRLGRTGDQEAPAGTEAVAVEHLLARTRHSRYLAKGR